MATEKDSTQTGSVTMEEEKEEQPPAHFPPVLTEALGSTPENRCYSLDPDALLMRIRWGLAQQYLKELKYLVPFPWKSHLRYPTHEQYVPIEIQQLDRSGQRPKKMLPNIGELFDALETEGVTYRPRHLLLRGEAGSGKTSFCRYFLYCWAKKIQIIDRLDFEKIILVYYPLRNLKPEDDVQDELLKLVHSHSTLHPSLIEHTEKCLFQGWYDEIVVMLDGYDEMDDAKMDHVRAVLQISSGAKHSVFRMATFIIVSRFETDYDLLYLFDRQFRFQGFTEANLVKFISKHVDEHPSAIMRKLEKHSIFKSFKLVGLAPVTILLVLDLIDGIEELNGEDSFIWNLIMALARRCNTIDQMGLDESEITRKLCRFGEFLYMCRLVKAKDFTWEEIELFMKDDFCFIKRCGIMQRKLCPPMGRRGHMHPQERLYGRCLQSVYIRGKWISMSSDHKREWFLRTFKVDSQAMVSVIIFRESTTQSRVCVRIVGDLSQVCFDWKIEDGEVARFLVTLQPFKEYKPRKECFRICVDFSERNGEVVELLLNTVRSYLKTAEHHRFTTTVADLLRNLNRPSFLVCVYDNTQEIGLKRSSGADSHSAKQIKVDIDSTVSYQSLHLSPSLLHSSKYLQISVRESWSIPLNIDKTLNSILDTELKNDIRDELIPEYLNNLAEVFQKFAFRIILILKFREAKQNTNVILNLEEDKVMISDAVYGDVQILLRFREVLKNREKFVPRFKWDKCYETAITITK